MSITTPIPVASNLKVFDIQGLTEQARKLINLAPQMVWDAKKRVTRQS